MPTTKETPDLVPKRFRSNRPDLDVLSLASRGDEADWLNLTAFASHDRRFNTRVTDPRTGGEIAQYRNARTLDETEAVIG